MSVVVRPAIADDRNFVVSGWSSSYRHSRDCTTPKSLYAKQKHEEIDHYLQLARVLVAHGESGVLFGFIAYDPTTYVAKISRRPVTLYGYVLYVYVESAFRKRGVARRLFHAAGIDPMQRFGYLCRTLWSRDLRSKIPLAEHEPYRARYEEVSLVRERTAQGTDPGQKDLVP